MFCILRDVNTKSYYMNAGDVAFHAYSDPSLAERTSKNARLIETDIDDIKEFNTMLYNAGFLRGYMEGEHKKLSKSDVYYYNRNPNDIAFAQWKLTGDERYLEMIRKNNLYTLCKVDGESIYFPTVLLQEEEETAVLAYTDPLRIPKELFDKYDGWRMVRMTFDARCVVNGAFVTQ